MTLPTPDTIITECIKNIEKFLREGMLQHAAAELNSAMTSMNRFHRKRSIQNEVSDIGDAIACVRPMESRCDDDDSMYSTIVRLLESKRDRLVDELETMV